MKAPEATPGDLTPKQIRAARALLAWSQQDLAKKAGVAASTVADFERGQRTPVPNNAEAMRKALESEGVHFLSGGAVIGPQLPALAASNSSGAPVRWVDATDLAQWAERRDGQAAMPTLIAKLIRAAHGPGIDIHFPADEGVQHPGWDGITRASQASRYVPEGTSGWEIGTQRQDIASKASDDFKKRSMAPGEIKPLDATFIFVTPRHWAQREKWVADKRALNLWRDVQAYDATDLVHWIELYPAVGQWLATHIGKRPVGVRQLEEVWLEWSLATQTPLTQDLILADRDDDAIAVLQWLRSSASLLALQAESADEAAAFAFAAISQLPSDAAQHYLNRCLVATSAETARMLADSITPLIIVLMDPEAGLAGRLAQRGHHVLLTYGGNTDENGDYRRLARPSRNAIERALTDAGVPAPRAESLARDSSRSLAILRRLIPSAPGRLPDWAGTRPSRGLLAALMAGGWNEQVESDKEILARLGKAPYADIAADLTALVTKVDSPIRKVGTAWKIASPQNAWSLLAKYLSATDIAHFEAAALDVLGAHDPRYDVDPEERWMAATKGIRPEYSGYLRNGLGETLILLSLFGDRVVSVAGVRSRAEYIVHKLLDGASRERWWSLSRDFRLLAEAAPMQFLDAIDDSLLRNDRPILSLFGADGGPFGGEHISNLLWALESLAWSPQNLGRVSATLAKLDSLDPGGKYSNRPDNSLAKIFSLWFPQTYASLTERLRALDHLRKIEPDSAWKLQLSMLPSRHGVITPSPYPRWRDYSQDKQEIVTYALLKQGNEEITLRLLQDVGKNPKRWTKLLQRMSHLAPDQTVAIKKLREVESQIVPAADRIQIWETLRGILHHHRQFPEAEWSWDVDVLNDIEAVYHAFEPNDSIERIAWLFKPGVGLPDPGVDGWRSNEAKIPLARQHAMKNLLDAEGVEGIFALARSVELAGYVGTTLTQLEIDPSTRDQILARALQSDHPRERDLAHGLIYSIFTQAKEPWASKLLAQAKQAHWGIDAELTILRALPVGRWTWDQARLAGLEIEDRYWKQIPTLWMEGDVDDVVFMASKLIDVGRARSALQFIGHHLPKQLPSELLIRVLEEAIQQSWEKNEADHNEATMFQYYVAEILKSLDAANISDDTMLQLEWAYLPVLEYSARPPKILIKALAERPEFFIEVLKALFKPSEESGIVEPPPKNPEHAQAVASQAFNLLRLWDRVPGTQADGRIDGALLENWVKEARKLAIAVGRADIADQKIGEALSASPPDEDGAWPAVAVRELIEITRSKHLETGFAIGSHNRRGVTTRSPGDGGILERDEAARYRAYAKATALEWPRTSAVLERIARDYDEDARWHDEDAERSEWRG
ncbi:MAG: helix-turn-helix domain-containing protein [Alphaproteobacteria bacterium]